MTFHASISNSDYHAHEAISSSDVKLVFKSTLAHWKAKVYKSSPTFDLGTAVHAMVLESHLDLVERGPEARRGKEWSTAYEDAQAEGKTLLTDGDYDIAREMADSLLFHPVGQRMSNGSTINEGSFFAVDPTTQLALKTRPDAFWQERGIIYDIKTCQDASPYGFGKDVQTYAYAIQAAFYMHVLRCAGYQADQFVFACVEKAAPYAVATHVLSPEYLEWGELKMHETLAKIANAQQSGCFETGWSSDVNVLELPRWLRADTI